MEGQNDFKSVDDMIYFVDITNYAEPRHIFSASLDEFIGLMKIQSGEINEYKLGNNVGDKILTHDNINKSILEITISSLVRMYFDIENIPNEELLFEILDKIIGLYNLPMNYAYTKNVNSTHEGLSYHVYFPIKAYKNDIYSLVKDFNFKTEFKYFNYIDYRVYGRNRLMRVVGSSCPGKVGHERNNNDYHALIKGNLEDTIIQSHKDLPQFNYIFENIDFVENKFSEKISSTKKIKFSDPATKRWDMFKYPYTNFMIQHQEIEKLKQQNKTEKIKNKQFIKEKELELQKDKQNKDFEIQKLKEQQKLEQIKWENQMKQNKDELELKMKEIELMKLQLQLEREKNKNKENNKIENDKVEDKKDN